MIYLDAAATTLQKPPEVSAAVLRAMTTMTSPGRGAHPAAMLAADTVFACRSALADLFHLGNPEQVVFTMNATHGLNLAIKSLVPPGGKVVISGYEHNAVTRPLAALGARVSVAEAPLFCPEAVIDAFEQMIVPETKAVICCHVSNVFGFILPIEKIAALCREREVPLIIDASQSAGVLPIDASALGAAFIAAPGHKGLYGPQGTGILLCSDLPVQTLVEGGTGSDSLRQEMPSFLPDRLEAGTHNVPGIAGLLAGVNFVRQRGMAAILHHERQLTFFLAEGLREFAPDLQVFSQPGLHDQTGVLSVISKRLEPETLGARMAGRGIALRAGYHCAPQAHKSAGTLEKGTLRMSFSAFNTMEEVCLCLDAFRACIS